MARALRTTGRSRYRSVCPHSHRYCPLPQLEYGASLQAIAPVRQMLDHGVKIGLGVDGSASNDSGHLLAEARQSMLLQRVGFGPDALSARQALEMATRGGAAVLGRNDIGHLAPGMAADLVAFDLNDQGYAGAWHDPLSALIFCTPQNVSHSILNGRIVIQDGQLTHD